MSIFSGGRTKYLWLVTVSFVLSLVSAGATFALLYSINKVAASQGAGDQGAAFVNGAVALLILFGVSAAMQHSMARLGSEGLADLRRMLAQRAIQVDYEAFVSQKRFILGALIGDAARIAPLFMLGPQFIYNLLLLLICSVYLAYLSGSMFLILCAGLMLQFVNAYFTVKHTRRHSEALRSCEDELYQSFAAIGAGKKEMLLSRPRREAFVEQILAPSIERAQRLTHKIYWYWGMNGTWGMATVYAFLFLVLYAGLSVLGVEPTTVMKFVVGVFFIIGPFSFIMNTGAPIVLALSSILHLRRMDLFPTSSAAQEDDGHRGEAADLNGWQRISLHQVRYVYSHHNSRPAQMGPYSLHVNRGEVLFIVGNNGSGKTTLLLLLSSLLQPSSGHVEIDGTCASKVLESYRGLFSAVFNDFYLFSHILDSHGYPAAANIVESLLEDLGLRGKVDYHEGLLFSLELSTGQRKRMALLQTYMDDRDIYLFDEWAADQDPYFRQHFYKTLLPQLKAKGKTVIAISHDEQYFEYADRVITL